MNILKAEGLEAVFARHGDAGDGHARRRQGGGTFYFPAGAPSDALTAISAPKVGRSGGLQEPAHAVWYDAAGGQDHLKGKIFRISHMGYIDSLRSSRPWRLWKWSSRVGVSREAWEQGCQGSRNYYGKVLDHLQVRPRQ